MLITEFTLSHVAGDCCHKSRYKIFEFSFTVLKRKEWKGAYPKFNPPETFSDIRLSEKNAGTSGVFYLNAIEAATSAMEISAISAKNIALLIAKDLKDESSGGGGEENAEANSRSDL